VKTFMVEK